MHTQSETPPTSATTSEAGALNQMGKKPEENDAAGPQVQADRGRGEVGRDEHVMGSRPLETREVSLLRIFFNPPTIPRSTEAESVILDFHGKHMIFIKLNDVNIVSWLTNIDNL